MKTTLANATLLMIAFFAASGVSQSTPRGTDQSPENRNVGTVTLQPSCTTTDDLLKYQQFLRKESDEENANLDRLIQRVEILATIAAAIFVFFGLKTTKGIRSTAKSQLSTIESEAKQKIEKVMEDLQRSSRARFDARFAHLEEAYERRQLKYFKLLRSYFSMLFVANPDLCSRWLGDDFKDHHFRGKKILWVDDDCVGIAMLIELLTNSGIQNETCGSTVEALDKAFVEFDLIVSNLRRDPEDNAGLLMTQRIRGEKQSKIPIIIFTRPEHKADYEEPLMSAGVNAIVTSDRELFPSIAILLDKKPANGEE